jgi:hypothetical protein
MLRNAIGFGAPIVVNGIWADPSLQQEEDIRRVLPTKSASKSYQKIS